MARKSEIRTRLDILKRKVFSSPLALRWVTLSIFLGIRGQNVVLPQRIVKHRKDVASIHPKMLCHSERSGRLHCRPPRIPARPSCQCLLYLPRRARRWCKFCHA